MLEEMTVMMQTEIRLSHFNLNMEKLVNTKEIME